LKIDFFGGDGQSNIAYYHDILRDSAPYGFLINFHGATIPRGWNRTYPHLMTMEAIKGLEFVTFAQSNADLEAAHAAVIPFTRGLWDPMDFTPMVLDRINLIERRTSSVFELALPVIFTSGITHFAEIPAAWPRHRNTSGTSCGSCHASGTTCASSKATPGATACWPARAASAG
jgi:hypothetical protein